MHEFNKTIEDSSLKYGLTVYWQFAHVIFLRFEMWMYLDELNNFYDNNNNPSKSFDYSTIYRWWTAAPEFAFAIKHCRGNVNHEEASLSESKCM